MANELHDKGVKNPLARDVMKTRLITLSPDMDIVDAVKVLLKNRVSGAPVVDDENHLLGVFSEKSVMKFLVEATYEQLPTNKIDGFMNREPRTIDENMALVSIAQIFLTSPWRRLPVLNDGKVVGQVSRRDVVEAALKLMSTQSSHEKRLLYLSALRDMQEPPSAVANPGA